MFLCLLKQKLRIEIENKLGIEYMKYQYYFFNLKKKLLFSLLNKKDIRFLLRKLCWQCLKKRGFILSSKLLNPSIITTL